MGLEVFVISNPHLFREGLNAVAAFCASPGFSVALHVGNVIGVLITIICYLKKTDPVILFKWAIAYVLMTKIFLGITTSVAIVNTSDQSIAPSIVDNVPIGIAYPAHLISTMGYGFTSDFETVFSLPNEVTYSKTGMLFGSNLFRLSLGSQIDDPEIMRNMNGFIRSCVVGDILINHKYSFNDLLNSKDIWATMTQKPSQIRGMYINGQFKTCKEGAQVLTDSINGYAKDYAPLHLAKFIPSNNAYSKAALNSMLTNSYNYFKASSDSATEILRQNIAINAFRSGIKNYAAEAGSVAAMANISNTMAMNNTRMAWATSQHIGVETLPLMQTVLFLLLVCLFPVIAVVAIIPGFGSGVIKNYFFSLVWLQSWPMMYAILNMAMNFYVQPSGDTPVTLSNINLLAQQHSDIQGIAGYLVLAIPFLSLGIVKGMAFTFNNAAQYLGGMMHSIAQSSAGSVAMGNYSMGNISTANATSNTLSANKYDSNFSSMEGMETLQMGNGTTISVTPMGDSIYHVGPGMSQLAVSMNASQNAVSSLSHQIGSSMSSAFNSSKSFSDSVAHAHAHGDTSNLGVNSQVSDAIETMEDVTHRYAETHDISDQAAWNKFSEASSGLSLSGSFTKGLRGIEGGVSGNAGISGRLQSMSSDSYMSKLDNNISSSDLEKFSHSSQVVENYAQSHSVSDQNTAAQNAAIQMGASLSQAHSLSDTAQFIESNSNSINSNFNQEFSGWMHEHHASEADAVLSNTSNPQLLARQEELAGEFVATHAHDLVANHQSNIGMINHDPSKYLMDNYVQNSKRIDDMRGNINAGDTNHIASQVGQNTNNIRQEILDANTMVGAQHDDLRTSSAQEISSGKKRDSKGVIRHIL